MNRTRETMSGTEKHENRSTQKRCRARKSFTNPRTNKYLPGTHQRRRTIAGATTDRLRPPPPFSLFCTGAATLLHHAPTLHGGRDGDRAQIALDNPIPIRTIVLGGPFHRSSPQLRFTASAIPRRSIDHQLRIPPRKTRLTSGSHQKCAFPCSASCKVTTFPCMKVSSP